MVHRMETSKTDDSFQHELEDYINKQKARGSQPNVCFRQVMEDSAHRGRGPTGPRPQVQEQRLPFHRLPKFPTSYRGRKTGKSQVPPWPKTHHSGQRPGSLGGYHKNQTHFFKSQWPLLPIFYWEDPSRFYWSHHQDRGQGRRPQEATGGGASMVEPQSQHRESGSLSKRKAQGEPVGTEKPKHRRKNQDGEDATKAGRRSHREKGPGDCSPERDLWDEAILGGSH